MPTKLIYVSYTHKYTRRRLKQQKNSATFLWFLDVFKVDVDNWDPTGFPGGPVVKNPPCNAMDTGLIPGPGRSHSGPCATVTESKL